MRNTDATRPRTRSSFADNMIVLVACLIVHCTGWIRSRAEPALYVSPKGNDAWSGLAKQVQRKTVRTARLPPYTKPSNCHGNKLLVNCDESNFKPASITLISRSTSDRKIPA